jgi:hypothetical protein
MKLTKSELREMVRAEILSESTNPTDIFNKAKSIVDEYVKSKKNYLSELYSLKVEYDKAVELVLTDKFNEFKSMIHSSKELRKIATISVPRIGKNRLAITLKPDARITIPDLIKMIHTIIGQPMGVFKGIVKGSGNNRYNVVIIGITEKYAKSIQSFPDWDRLNIFSIFKNY